MPELIQSREERRYLCDASLTFLAANPLTASHLAHLLHSTRSKIHSALLSLRIRGLIEAVDLCSDMTGGAGYEYVWRPTEHARFHDPGKTLPGESRCKHCRRSYAEW
jgi:predicted transcriptional regulator